MCIYRLCSCINTEYFICIYGLCSCINTEYFICIYGLCSCVLPDVSTHILCIVHDVFTCAVYDVVTYTVCDLPIGCLQCVVCSHHMYCVWDVHMIYHV